MNPEQCLDVSQLEPPEPMEYILSAMDALEQGCYLKVWIHREPFLLYDILERERFSYTIRLGRHSAFELFIWPAQDKMARDLVQAAMQGDSLDRSG